jgi:hypothetical protein
MVNPGSLGDFPHPEPFKSFFGQGLISGTHDRAAPFVTLR